MSLAGFASSTESFVSGAIILYGGYAVPRGVEIAVLDIGNFRRGPQSAAIVRSYCQGTFGESANHGQTLGKDWNSEAGYQCFDRHGVGLFSGSQFELRIDLFGVCFRVVRVDAASIVDDSVCGLARNENGDWRSDFVYLRKILLIERDADAPA